MEAKLTNYDQSSKVPAGIFTGTELFALDGQMYALQNGNCTLFTDLPSMEKRKFIDLYLADKEGQKFIQKTFGITGFESGFSKWLFCKFGSLDGDPDNIDGQISPDSYNSACSRTDCPGRGKFCGTSTKIKGYEVETIRELKTGKTAIQAADTLCISESAVKSRISNLKEKLNVANIAALIATATELGI